MVLHAAHTTIEDILLFGNSFMLKKYNVTVQHVLVYDANQRKMSCNITTATNTTNTTAANRMLKCNVDGTIIGVTISLIEQHIEFQLFKLENYK